MNKIVFILLGVVIAIAGAVYWAKTTPAEPREPVTAENFKTYTDPASGFSFRYREEPDGYVLIERPAEALYPNHLKTYVLMLRSDQKEMENTTVPREGPPAISVQILKNSKRQQPRMWAEEHTNLSNIQLARGGDVTDELFKDLRAIRYTADGLYLSDTIVVAHGDHMYVISGEYIDGQSATRRDFGPFLDSIAFTSSAGE